MPRLRHGTYAAGRSFFVKEKDHDLFRAGGGQAEKGYARHFGDRKFVRRNGRRRHPRQRTSLERYPLVCAGAGEIRSFAKAYAFALGVPLIGVDHIRGHMAAAYLADPALEPPFVTLLASGGHTAVIYTKSYTEFEIMGSTRDDAAGEAFDKAARVLGLPYPGGPNIEKLAREGKAVIPFPKMFAGGGYDFSYSGLKTAVINYCHGKEQKGEAYSRADVAASFQSAACGVLAARAVAAAKEKGADTVVAGGGVIANGYLRALLAEECARAGLRLVLPEKKFCTDNAAMIAAEGLIQYRAGNFSDLSLNACAHIPLGKKGKQ